MADKEKEAGAAGTATASSTGAGSTATRTVKRLNTSWGWRGKIYGPGNDVVVPADFPQSAEERDADMAAGNLAYTETSRPGTSGSKIAQTEDIVNPDGTVHGMNVEQYADAAKAAREQAKQATGGSADSGEEDEKLPKVDDLEDHIADMSDDEVREMQARDSRKGAQVIYERRLEP